MITMAVQAQLLQTIEALLPQGGDGLGAHEVHERLGSYSRNHVRNALSLLAAQHRAASQLRLGQNGMQRRLYRREQQL